MVEEKTYRYRHFNVPQGIQNIVLEERNKADDIRTYTDKYTRSNEARNRLEGCVKQLNPEVRYPQTEELGRRSGSQMPGPQFFHLTQGGPSFQGPTNVSESVSYQGNFAGFDHNIFGGWSTK